MELEPQTVINFLFGLLGLCLGYILNSVRAAVESLQRQDVTLAEKVQRIEVLVAGQYVQRKDLDTLWTTMSAKLDRIEQKLDGKADKT